MWKRVLNFQYFLSFVLIFERLSCIVVERRVLDPRPVIINTLIKGLKVIKGLVKIN